MAVYPIFPGGKRKAFTLSYDDAWPEDRKLIALMNKYGLKGTFNLNSGDKRFASIPDVKELYSGHEVAVHALTHAYLDRVSPQTATYEIIKDRENLEKVFGGSIRGFAYPYSAFNHDTPQILKNCGIAYARTVECTGNFSMPGDWYRWHPTCDHQDENLLDCCEKFLKTNPAFNQCSLFYVYGHSFQLERDNDWGRIEELFKRVSGRDDIWYATNIEICDYISAFKNLIMSVDGNYISNPTTTTLSLIYTGQDFMETGRTFEIKPSEEIYLDSDR